MNNFKAAGPIKSIREYFKKYWKIGLYGAIGQFLLGLLFQMDAERGNIATLAAFTWIFVWIIMPLFILFNYYREQGFELNFRNSQIVIGIFVLIGIFDIEAMAYYTFVRIIVTGLSIALALDFYNNKKENTIHIYGVIFIIFAIIYNPIIPFHFSKDTWIFINFLTGGVFISKSFLFDSWKD